MLAAPRPIRAEDPGATIGGGEEEVDLLLVLAADVSHSMQHGELVMQREGYVAALRDRQVLEAIGSGPTGAIGLTYFEWSGAGDHAVLLPWTRLSGAADAERVAALLAGAPLRSGTQTSISSALAAARRLLGAAPFAGARRVVDVSGDGENNHGEPVEDQRDQAVAEGVTINGLPIVRHGARAAASGEGRETGLEEHYRGQVIGGAGAFLLPAYGFDAFAGAVRRKLVLEIAAGGDASPAGPVMRA
jgi:hypothetical protein